MCAQRNSEITSSTRIPRQRIRRMITIAQIQRRDSGCDGDSVKRSLPAAPVFLLPIIPLLFFGVVLWQWPALAVAQSGVSDDVKHDTPGQLIKPVNPSILMSTWRL